MGDPRSDGVFGLNAGVGARHPGSRKVQGFAIGRRPVELLNLSWRRVL